MEHDERIELLIEHWGKETTSQIIQAIDTCHPDEMTMDDFMPHCIACGGNWGGMLLSGVKQLYPSVWDAIPSDMGNYAWCCILCVISLLKIE